MQATTSCPAREAVEAVMLSALLHMHGVASSCRLPGHSRVQGVGLAAGLRLAPGVSHLSRAWIINNRPAVPNYAHGGMLMGLGLIGTCSDTPGPLIPVPGRQFLPGAASLMRPGPVSAPGGAASDSCACLPVSLGRVHTTSPPTPPPHLRPPAVRTATWPEPHCG